MSTRSTRRSFLTKLAVAPIALSPLAAAACGGNSAVREDGSVDLTKVTLTIGDQAGIQQSLVEAAGVLDGKQYEVRWSQFAAAAPLLEALRSGAVDIGLAGDAPTLNALGSGADIKIVSATRSVRQYGLAIVVPQGSPITSVADLRGKTVSPTTPGSVGHYLLLSALREAGVPANEVRISFLEPVNASAALSSGAIDAWSTWDPYTAAAQLDQGATVLRDANGLAHGLSFINAYQEALDDPGRRAAVRDFVGRYNKALDWARAEPAENARIYGELSHRPPNVARLVSDRSQRTGGPVDDQVIAQLQEVADNYREFGVLREHLAIAEHVDRGLY
ncbi:ABC transporter substrate-binding protein [Saccharopolyspora gloriosae]|uniref:Putative aliphatic sulfonates-binding protein n=1 Tax=Saccharopolyspora gloriosae TaxID=455344 RepID=A0A840NE66_9PSEU|nr:ABC transporter substrate-binding protein [Saccharopolyspora gloriosae]MBB5069261.1 sulfonate transport system substrate-binding protein [Saccharopolyspora gloriosae]